MSGAAPRAAGVTRRPRLLGVYCLARCHRRAFGGRGAHLVRFRDFGLGAIGVHGGVDQYERVARVVVCVDNVAVLPGPSKVCDAVGAVLDSLAWGEIVDIHGFYLPFGCGGWAGIRFPALLTLIIILPL